MTELETAPPAGLDAAIPPSPRSPAIRIQGLSHWFGHHQVLDDVTLRVNPGEIFGFIGRNGAGKSTTLRILATVLEPMRGTVEIDGVDIRREPERVRHHIGYLPDHASFYERITVEEHLAFFAAAFGLDPEKAISRTVAELGLSEHRRELLRDLSQGTRQRLGLARVLLHDPSVLILDEPASNLDPHARRDFQRLLIELKRRQKTVFLSSHILSDLSEICTTVGIIDKGRLLACGPISDLARRLTRRREAQRGPESTPPPAPRPHPASGAAPPAEAGLESVRIRLAGDRAQVVGLLRASPAICDLEPVGSDGLSVRYRGGRPFVAELVRYLVGHGVSILSVEPERSELERIFLDLTEPHR